jgi:hypothetical protein
MLQAQFQFPAHRTHGIAKSGILNALRRWLFGEWIPIDVAGTRVATVRSRRRIVEVEVGAGVAMVQGTADDGSSPPTGFP